MMVVLIAAALMAADPAAATTPVAPVTATTAKPPANDLDKVVCISEEVTGTRFPKKQCHTKREWKAITQDSRDTLDDATTHHETQSPLAGH